MRTQKGTVDSLDKVLGIDTSETMISCRTLSVLPSPRKEDFGGPSLLKLEESALLSSCDMDLEREINWVVVPAKALAKAVKSLPGGEVTVDLVERDERRPIVEVSSKLSDKEITFEQAMEQLKGRGRPSHELLRIAPTSGRLALATRRKD